MKQVTFANYIKKKEEGISDGFVKVTFLKDVPQFVGINLKYYGPFKTGDKSMIPLLNSVGLKKKGGCI